MTTSDMNAMVAALRRGAVFLGHENIVAVQRYGPDADCIGMKVVDTDTGIFIDVMPFAEKKGGSELLSPCIVHKGPGHKVIYPRAEIFPVAQCRFAGGMHWCPRQIERYLRRSYDSLEVPRQQLHGRNVTGLSAWYRAKAKDFDQHEAAARAAIQQCCSLPPDFRLTFFGVGNVGSTGATFQLRVSLADACVVTSTTPAATYDNGDLEVVRTRTDKECISHCERNTRCTHFTSQPGSPQRSCRLKHENATLGGAPESWVSGKIVRLGLAERARAVLEKQPSYHESSEQLAACCPEHMRAHYEQSSGVLVCSSS